MKRMLGAAVALLATPVILAGGVQAAQTLPEELDVSIEIVEACEVGTIAPINFGTQGTLAAVVDAAGSVDVTCPNGVPYSIALDVGAGDGATLATRKMTGPDSETVNYSLYQNSDRSTVWGDEDSVNRLTSAGTGEAQTHPIYGRVPIQSTPAVGTYSDTVTVVVHY